MCGQMRKKMGNFPSPFQRLAGTPKELTGDPGPDTLVGGTAGHQERSKSVPLVSSADDSRSELAQALDSALGAVSGMFAAALRPHSTGARARLDQHYEDLITLVEVFRETVPKA